MSGAKLLPPEYLMWEHGRQGEAMSLVAGYQRPEAVRQIYESATGMRYWLGTFVAIDFPQLSIEAAAALLERAGAEFRAHGYRVEYPGFLAA